MSPSSTYSGGYLKIINNRNNLRIHGVGNLDGSYVH